MKAVARDRAADRGCTGGGEVADDAGARREKIPGGLLFSGPGRRRVRIGRQAAERADRLAPIRRAIEPWAHPTRLNPDAAGASGQRGANADCQVLLGRRRRFDGGAHCAQRPSPPRRLDGTRNGPFRDERLAPDRGAESGAGKYQCRRGVFHSDAAGREIRRFGAPVASIGARSSPLILIPGGSAGAPLCRNVTVTEFEMPTVVGRSRAH